MSLGMAVMCGRPQFVSVFFLSCLRLLNHGRMTGSMMCLCHHDEQPQLLNQEIDRRNGVSLDEVLAVIKDGLTDSA
jgi:hypothetical protein